MTKILNNVEFIVKANLIHNNKYDYSKSVYINSRTNIKIICPIHGEFLQLANNHLCGRGCKICGTNDTNNLRKLNNDEFINKANLVHNYKYDYSLINYVNNRTNIKIICSTHGEFSQLPSNHLRGNGCIKCGMNKTYSSRRLKQNDYINKVKLVHNNKYDYLLVNYVNACTKINIICPTHGEFMQRASHHAEGNGCPKCNQLLINNEKKLTLDIFIQKASLVHNNKYDYSKSVYVNSREKINIICSKHGLFSQIANNHLKGNGCPKCVESTGEQKIRSFFEKNNLKYIKQKKFNNCKNKKYLSFDFYLPRKNILIEYDGIQHFEQFEYFGGRIGFLKTRINDIIKNRFAKESKINLIRIRYDETIEDRLKFLV